MKSEYIWEITAKNTPTLKRKCNHCNSGRFYCSGKFRMNSQKKNLDVWLIYRCTECDSTFNLPILSRAKPARIKKDLFAKFSENDEATAWEYAFPAETGRKNNIELDYASVEYEIRHDMISINDILNAEHEFIAFKIQSRFEFGLKLSSVVRSCLGLSANQWNRMIESKTIFTPEDYPLKKRKVKNGDLVLVNREKLRSIYKPDDPVTDTK